MAITSKDLYPARNPARNPTRSTSMPQALLPISYLLTALLAMLAIYALVSAVVGWGSVRLDDLRYGRPRTTQLSALVGHEGDSGQPSHFIAMNLNRQVVVLELPGGDATNIRSLPGPYLFGAGEDLTAVAMSLQDADGDGQADLLLDVRRERIVYLNKDGAFRLPSAEEQRQLVGQP
ncbi:MAG: hypothetical protein H7Y32_08890 [Chloroflexales bacterium]|nr:hypothetical protein [Chloroflexales bacterium]